MKALAFPWLVVNELGWVLGRSSRIELYTELTRLLCKLADLGDCFNVLIAVFRYRPSEVVSSLNGGADLWR